MENGRLYTTYTLYYIVVWVLTFHDLSRSFQLAQSPESAQIDKRYNGGSEIERGTLDVYIEDIE